MTEWSFTSVARGRSTSRIKSSTPVIRLKSLPPPDLVHLPPPAPPSPSDDPLLLRAPKVKRKTAPVTPQRSRFEEPSFDADMHTWGDGDMSNTDFIVPIKFGSSNSSRRASSIPPVEAERPPSPWPQSQLPTQSDNQDENQFWGTLQDAPSDDDDSVHEEPLPKPKGKRLSERFNDIEERLAKEGRSFLFSEINAMSSDGADINETAANLPDSPPKPVSERVEEPSLLEESKQDAWDDDAPSEQGFEYPEQSMWDDHAGGPEEDSSAEVHPESLSTELSALNSSADAHPESYSTDHSASSSSGDQEESPSSPPPVIKHQTITVKHTAPVAKEEEEDESEARARLSSPRLEPQVYSAAKSPKPRERIVNVSSDTSSDSEEEENHQEEPQPEMEADNASRVSWDDDTDMEPLVQIRSHDPLAAARAAAILRMVRYLLFVNIVFS